MEGLKPEKWWSAINLPCYYSMKPTLYKHNFLITSTFKSYRYEKVLEFFDRIMHTNALSFPEIG
jgi:hypothetical protein